MDDVSPCGQVKEGLGLRLKKPQFFSPRSGYIFSHPENLTNTGPNVFIPRPSLCWYVMIQVCTALPDTCISPAAPESPWGWTVSPMMASHRQRGEQTMGSSRQCYFAFLIFIFSAKLIAPWTQMSSSGWETGTFSMGSEHSLSEQKTLGKQCAK